MQIQALRQFFRHAKTQLYLMARTYLSAVGVVGACSRHIQSAGQQKSRNESGFFVALQV